MDFKNINDKGKLIEKGKESGQIFPLAYAIALKEVLKMNNTEKLFETMIEEISEQDINQHEDLITELSSGICGGGCGNGSDIN